MSEQRSSLVAVAVFVASVVLLLGVALVANRSGRQAKDAQTNPEVAAAVDDEDYPPLPSLAVVRNGQALQLAGPRTKPTLLHLWATWCGPCRAELPVILDYGRSGPFDVVAVSVDDEWPSVQQFFKMNIPAEVAWDQKIIVERALGVNSLPTTFVIDTAGRVRRTFVGAQDWSDAALRRSVEMAAR